MCPLGDSNSYPEGLDPKSSAATSYAKGAYAHMIVAFSNFKGKRWLGPNMSMSNHRSS